MQQVDQISEGAKKHKNLSATDNYNLAGQKKRKRVPKTFIAIKQLYVLHNKWISRFFLLFVFLIIIIISFQQKDNISKGTSSVSFFISKQLASLGFGIDEVLISGQSLTYEQQILDALAIGKNQSLLTLNAKEVRKKIMQLPAISATTVRKIFPNKLVVEINEITPIALWRVSGETFYISKNGKKLSTAQESADNALPLVIGKGAATGANDIINALNKYPLLNNNLIAFSKIANRRWDLIYDNGLRVQLPEIGLTDALERLNEYQTKYALFEKDINLIDVRISDSLVVRLIKRDDEGGN